MVGSQGGGPGPQKKKTSWLVWLIVLVPVTLAVILFVGGVRDRMRSAEPATQARSAVVVQEGSRSTVPASSPSPSCPKELALEIPGSNDQDSWSKTVKPGDCNVIFMDDPRSIKRRYRYAGESWSYDQHEKRAGFDEAEYQNTAPEPVTMRLRFRPGA